MNIRKSMLAFAWLTMLAVAGCSAGPSGADAGDVKDLDVATPDSTADVARDSNSVSDADNGPADATGDGSSLDVRADVQCCDPETGECGPCHDECWSCGGDWACAPGSRCWIAKWYAGICTPECETVADCPDSLQYTCTQRDDEIGVCAPKVNTCPGCYEPTPYPVDDRCVECRVGADCGGTECCDPDLHVCREMLCATGTIFNLDLCECKQCFEDADCQRFEDATGICLDDGTCEGVLPCDGLCTSDFPVCTVVGGVEQCVQCASDDDCLALGYEGCTCVGDSLYYCIDGSGSYCNGERPACAPCWDSSSCPSGPSGQVLECIQMPMGYGTCIDPAGSCDGVAACCNRGQACRDLALILQEIYPSIPRLIPQPAVTATFCGCDTADDCLAGGPCTNMSILCTSGDYPMEGMYDIICPDGQPHEAFPDKLCAQPATLLEYFGLVPAAG